MFYSQFILAKKGPLGTIWIAAHLERKLRKTQVTETNISVSVDSILFPDVPIALRLSGHLLLGVVRIYSRKVNYLFHDCSEALVKIKQAFHAGAVDLPPEASTAPFHSITLPETFDIDDLELLPDHDSALFLANSSIDHHVTAREQITLQDPIDDNAYMNAQFGIDERFPDEGEQRLTLEFEENEGCEKLQNEERSPVLEDDVLPSIEVDEEIEKDGNTAMELDTEPIKLSVDNQSEFPAILTVSDTVVSDDTNARCQIPVAGSDDMEENVLQPCAQESVQEARSEEAVGPAVVIAEVDALDEGPQVENMETEGTELDGIKDADELVDDAGETAFTEPTEMTAERLDGDVQISESPQQLLNEVPDVEKLRSADATVNFAAIDDKLQCEHPVLEEATSEASLKSDTVHESRQFDETPVLKLDSSISLRKSTPPSVLTVPDFEDVPDDDDVLASILGRRTRALRVAPTPTDLPPAKRQKRGPKPVSKKRKIVFDKQTVLHGDAMREQLADTSDIRRVRLKAPCTEYEIWGSERQAQCQNIFYEPSIPGLSEELRELYHCIYEEQLPLASAADLERQNSLAAPVATESVDGTDNVQQLCLAGPTEERDENHPAAKSITLADGEISNCEPESIIDDAPDIQQEPLDLAVDDTKTEENISAGEEHSLQVSVENSKGDEAVAINQSEDGQEDIATVPEESQALSENAIEQENEAQEEKLEDETAAVRVDDDNHQDIINAEECEQSSPIEKHDAPSEAAYTEVNNGEIKGDCEVDTEGCLEQKVVVSDMVAVEEEALASVGTPAQDTEASVGHVTDEEHPQEALEFLTDAKDADDEASDDSVEDDHVEDATKVQDNSGWSSRTRAVAQYLRMTFDTMENNKTTPNLNLDRLLHGKCRREAARMFFETLVLKTKDYIHTEQSHSYADIRIEPRTKLMKADH